MYRVVTWVPSVALLALGAVVVSSCQDPTEITLEITTDVACAKLTETSVAAGIPGEIENADPATVTKQCAAGRIGSLVVTPARGNQDEVAIRVVAGIGGKRADACVRTNFAHDSNDPPGAGCIVARRQLAYVEHKPLLLPVLLEEDCIDNPCDPTTTCVRGRCVSANAACEGDRCEPSSKPDGGRTEAGPNTGGAGGEAGAGGTDASAGAGGRAGAGGSSGGRDAGRDAPQEATPPCSVAACNNPPASTCNGDAVETFASTGSCVDGSCHYEPIDTPCGQNETCVGGACECRSGYTLCNTTCVDLKTDSKNCGACDHDCMFGTCGGATCASWLVARVPVALMRDLASDGTNVVWIEGRSIREASVSAGAPITLGTVPSGWDPPFDVALSGGVVAWTSWQPPGSSTVHTGVFTATEGVPNSSGGAVTASTQTGPFGGPAALALNSSGGEAYYIDTGTSELVACTLAGVLSSCRSVTFVAKGAAPGDVLERGGTLFVAEFSSGSVFEILTTGAGKTNVSTGEPGPYTLALDSSFVYWANQIIDTSNKFSIRRNAQTNPVPAAAADVVGVRNGDAVSIATDGKYVYYAGTFGGPSTVSYVPVGGGTARILYTGPAAGSAGGLVAVGGAVYLYDTGDGTIRGVAAPL